MKHVWHTASYKKNKTLHHFMALTYSFFTLLICSSLFFHCLGSFLSFLDLFKWKHWSVISCHLCSMGGGESCHSSYEHDVNMSVLTSFRKSPLTSNIFYLSFLKVTIYIISYFLYFFYKINEQIHKIIHPCFSR